MTARVVTDLLDGPQWYAAIYGLVAHQAHAALNDGRERLVVARDQALLLSLASVAAIDRKGVGGWPTALGELDRRVFPRPKEPETPQAADLPAAAVQAASRSLVPERYRVRKGGPRPTGRRGRVPRAGPVSVKHAPEPEPPPGATRRSFLAFLTETVEPSALVLLAGVTLAVRPGFASDSAPAGWDRKTVLEHLINAATLKEPLRPRWLADGVAARDDLTGRSQYNLACFYAQAAELDDDVPRDMTLERARDHLVLALATTPATGRGDLAAWAWRDPSLEPALRDWDEAVVILGSNMEVPAAGGPATGLAQITAIRPFADILADIGIRTPGELRLATDSRRVHSLARALDVSPGEVFHWGNLVRLLELDGLEIPHVNLLDAAAVGSIEALAELPAELLHERIARINAGGRLVARTPTPTLNEVGQWVRLARRSSQW